MHTASLGGDNLQVGLSSSILKLKGKMADSEVLWEKEVAADSPLSWRLSLDTAQIIRNMVKALEFNQIPVPSQPLVDLPIDPHTEMSDDFIAEKPRVVGQGSASVQVSDHGCCRT
ncbi:hypothetical protein PVL29_022726 [Vitis rotundifolia]|uniref:Uncharacterized protein n=1 Tax=Vitis rotundifolia TaxID=103349 RepID=A0AA39DBQ4_VITRO|nr:hypothetical protein PVL29_022726 [Vitis rotundifolia]